MKKTLLACGLFSALVALLQRPISGSLLYPEARVQTWDLAKLMARINAGDRIQPELMAYYLTLTTGKLQDGQLLGDKTVRNFISLNRFQPDQCKEVPLKQRAHFCHSLMPEEMKGDFDAAENLRLFCRTTLFLVAKNCVELGGGQPPVNKLGTSFIEPMSAMLLSKLATNLVDHLSSKAEARFRPTELEGYLLEESGEN